MEFAALPSSSFPNSSSVAPAPAPSEAEGSRRRFCTVWEAQEAASATLRFRSRLAQRKARTPHWRWCFQFYPLACGEKCALGLGQRLLELLEHAARALKRFDKSLNIPGRGGDWLLQL